LKLKKWKKKKKIHSMKEAEELSMRVLIQFNSSEMKTTTKENRTYISLSYSIDRQRVNADRLWAGNSTYVLSLVSIFAPRLPNLCFGKIKRRNKAVVWLGIPLTEANTEPFWFGCTTRTVGWSFEDRVSDWHYDTLFPKLNEVNFVK
jgi:hypothetical protein